MQRNALVQEQINVKDGGGALLYDATYADSVSNVAPCNHSSFTSLIYSAFFISE